jgi:hypothetical protein
MRVPPILPRADDVSARTIKRSRIVSYTLAAVAAALLSISPALFDVPASGVVHVLVAVVRPIAVAVLLVAAVGVQVLVGIRWRSRAGVVHRDDSAQEQRPHGR